MSSKNEEPNWKTEKQNPNKNPKFNIDTNMPHRKIITAIAALLTTATLMGQNIEKVHYTGSEMADPTVHDGRLSPVVGVHNIEVVRALRSSDNPIESWTYNHQPMLAWWRGRYWLEYLADPVSEHVPPSQTLVCHSKDGYRWSQPEVAFPIYRVPDGYTKPNVEGTADHLDAVMHQRTGFYVSKSGELFALANYGVALNPKDNPNDGNGIGRVIRRIFDDGSMGEICFIYYNHAFDSRNTDYKYYTKSKDRELRKACEEILANPLYVMQWVEEADTDEKLIPLNKPYKAFSYYHISDSTVVGLWKHALTSISVDNGATWSEPVERAAGFVNSNAKIWGQRLSDGNYATVYNPSEYRWPLALSLSNNGIEYTTLNLVCGEVPPERYGGNYKNRGPQYVRGIQECNTQPDDGNLHVAYSMNKEDIWVAHIPVPVRLAATSDADDRFDQTTSIGELNEWNIYSPLWANVAIERIDNRNMLALNDSDPFDYALAERKIRPDSRVEVTFTVRPAQNDHGELQIELTDENGTACTRLDFTSTGELQQKTGARYSTLTKYEADKEYEITIAVDAVRRMAAVTVNGRQSSEKVLFAPVKSVERVRFRTGSRRTFPTVDTPADNYDDLPDSELRDRNAQFAIGRFASKSSCAATLLNYADYEHYIDYFNSMEDENVVQAIPNSQSSEWIEENVPLFDCPARNFQEIYYYRWWTLRKHIIATPTGYAMTEFIVPRSHADRYNMIACATSHHLYESRWLRDRQYAEQYLNVWFHGNNGGEMEKLHKFSSWLPDAVWNKWLVDGRSEFVDKMYDDLKADYNYWEQNNRLENGLYWQGDVQDGMEESISGGRRQRFARPTINSYMYGNAVALANMAQMRGNQADQALYRAKADTIRELILTKLWNSDDSFFETLRADTLACVREAIGYIPWYFGLVPDKAEYAVAWQQTTLDDGFDAPFGLTTAERRHPQYRTHGTGTCEWDGAVWPFATSQTLTAMIRHLNTQTNHTIGDTLFVHYLTRYVESQYRRSRPYIGEYMDPDTGAWLMGDRERSRYYNHSTFNDLIITGLCGLQPRADQTIEVNPMVPHDWNWFCIDALPYHGRLLTIVWDRDGSRYHQGSGLQILIDGKSVAQRNDIGRLTAQLE